MSEILFKPGLFEIVVLVMQVASVALLVYAVFSQPRHNDPPANRRIAMAMGLHERNTVYEITLLIPVTNLMLILASRFPFFRDQIKQNLETTGNPQNYTVDEYIGVCLLWSMSTSGILTVFNLMTMGPSVATFFFVGIGILIGFFVPYSGLRSAAKKRMVQISKRLPYTLDLIALLMEAGATFTEALKTIIADDPADPLNEELWLLQSEIDFGTQRATALRNMAERVPLDTLKSIVGAVNQAESLGTPLSVILKNQSGMLRNQRSVRAEDLSARASTKILIPSALIMIGVLIVLFAPLILKWVNGETMAA